MKHLKKIYSSFITLIVITISIFTLSACGNQNTNQCQHQWIEADCLYPKTCRLCGETDGVALGHTEVIDEAVEATCTSTGLTEGKHCSVCNKIIIAQTTTPKTGHEWGNPTCTTPRSCIVCFEVDETSKPLGHSFVNGECSVCGEDDPDYSPVTITADKYNIELEATWDFVYITVSGDCTVVWDVNNENIVTCEWGEWEGYTIPLIFYPISSGTTFVTVYLEEYNESIKINVTVKEHKHNYTETIIEPTCTEQGFTNYYCECGDSYKSDYVKANGHTEVILPAVEPTLTSTGLTEGKYCSVCGEVLVEQEEIPMLELTPADETTFELTNKLTEVYGYYNSRLQAYTKCKIDSVDYEITNSSGGKITLKIKLFVEKTYQGDQGLDNLKFDYTIYRDGVAVKSSFVTILHAEFDTLYETTITYTGEPGNYTMTLESYY